MIKLKHYSNEFKQAAVKRYHESRHGLPFVASEMDVSVSALYRWVKEMESNKVQEEPNINDLMDQIKELKKQNSLYIKAITYLSKTCKIELTVNDLFNIINSDFKCM